jgi:septum formation topological specificity factor MinE
VFIFWGNIPGAYVSLESELIRYIKHHVNPEADKIKIKISGDGSNGFKSTLTVCPSVLSNFKYWGTRP